MKTRSLIIVSAALLLLPVGFVFGQEAAPAPPTPPAARAPQGFSWSYDGGGNFLGITPQEVTKENMSRYGLQEPRGVAVAKVISGSPADRAGLKKDDVIVRFDGETVTNLHKLNRLLAEAEPEHTAKIGIRRDGTEQEISVTLERKTSARAFGDYSSAAGALANRAQELGKLNQQFKDFGGNGNNFVFAAGSSRRIGVSTSRLTKQLGEYFGVSGGEGLLVTSVKEDSPAAKAGIKAGDVITEVNSEKTANAAQLTRAINKQNEGEITLTIIRHKDKKTIKLTPEAGRAFDWSPEEFQVWPQIGEIEVPETFDFNMEPLMNLQVPLAPQIEIPPVDVQPFAVPNIDMEPIIRLQVAPKIDRVVIPAINVKPVVVPNIDMAPIMRLKIPVEPVKVVVPEIRIEEF